MPDNTQFDGFSTFDDITEDAVMDYIQSLGSDKAIHDSIPVKVYEFVASSIIKPITYIINISLKTDTMPELCKTATITTVYKSEGDKQDPSNYRPISIIPLLGKCIEYLLIYN